MFGKKEEAPKGLFDTKAGPAPAGGLFGQKSEETKASTDLTKKTAVEGEAKA